MVNGSDASTTRDGAKERDYLFTVLAVDPLAIPLMRLLAKTSWWTPDRVSWLALLLGLPIGAAFATGTRVGLIVGAALWYLSFLLDCVDGKLARFTGTSSPRGQVLDTLGDGLRRASSVIGLVVYLWKVEGAGEALLGVIFGILAFYVIELSGGEMSSSAIEPRGRWAILLARRRILPLPGMTDVSAIAFVLGPVTGWVVPGVIVGLVLVVGGVARHFLRVLRSSS